MIIWQRHEIIYNYVIKIKRELIKQKYYSGTSSTNVYIHCCDFYDSECVVRVYEDNQAIIGSYCVNKNTGLIIQMF